MAKLTVSLTIKAKPAIVYNYLTNTKTHLLWNSGLVKISSTQPLTKGMVYETENIQLGRDFKARNVVTKIVPNEEVIIMNTSGPLHYTVMYKLQPVGAGSVLTCECDIQSSLTIFKIAESAVEALATNKLHGDLTNLKTLVESEN